MADTRKTPARGKKRGEGRGEATKRSPKAAQRASKPAKRDTKASRAAPQAQKSSAGKKRPAVQKQRPSGDRAREQRSGGDAAGDSSRQSATGDRRDGLSARDAVQRAREHLSVLLGRPVETVSAADRDHGNWIVTAQVIELARIPNTTDVLGEYEAVIDRGGEIVSYRRTHRYHRGHVDSEA
jgi:Gas vesicle synthesis protein GvpO